MHRKQFTTVVLSSILAASMMSTPLMSATAMAAESETAVTMAEDHTEDTGSDDTAQETGAAEEAAGDEAAADPATAAGDKAEAGAPEAAGTEEAADITDDTNETAEGAQPSETAGSVEAAGDEAAADSEEAADEAAADAEEAAGDEAAADSEEAADEAASDSAEGGAEDADSAADHGAAESAEVSEEDTAEQSKDSAPAQNHPEAAEDEALAAEEASEKQEAATATKVKLIGNGGFWRVWDDDLGKMVEKEEITAVYDESRGIYVILERPIPRDTSKAFLHWEAPDGTIVKDGDDWPAEKGDVTLTAVWSDSYTIHLDANGGYFTTRDDDGNDIYRAETMTRKVARGQAMQDYWAYTDDNSVYLSGWSTERGGEPIEDIESYVPTGNMTLYACWKNYTHIVFDANGGVYPEDPEFDYSAAVSADRTTAKVKQSYGVSTPDRIPYYKDGSLVLKGWSTEKNGKPLINQTTEDQFGYPTELDLIDLVGDGGVLYAVWVRPVKITLNANGGKFRDGKTSTTLMDAEGEDITLYNPQNDDPNLFFEGWSNKPGWPICIRANKNCGYTYVTCKEDMTLYAVWSSAKPAEQPTKPVEQPINLSKASVVGILNKVYTGKAITQSPTVKMGAQTLVKDKDYTLSYAKNVNAGTATVVIKGKGKYAGSITRQFVISKAENEITARDFVRTYSAKARTFRIGARAAGGKLTYSSNKAAVKVTDTGKVTIGAKFTGSATITIKAGDANYKTVTKQITVTVPRKVSLSAARSKGAGKVKVTWKKGRDVSGYQVQYAANKKFTKGKKTVLVKGARNTSKTITGLKKGRKYFVRIRAYRTVGKGKVYSPWSGMKSVKVKK